jgi:hypothetical protein
MCLLVQAHVFLSSMMNLSSCHRGLSRRYIADERLFCEVFQLSVGGARCCSLRIARSDHFGRRDAGYFWDRFGNSNEGAIPNCKILLFSGQAATSDLLEDARAQGYDFRLLQKPVHPSEFLFEIGQLSTGFLQALPLAESLMPAQRILRPHTQTLPGR